MLIVAFGICKGFIPLVWNIIIPISFGKENKFARSLLLFHGLANLTLNLCPFPPNMGYEKNDPGRGEF